MRNLLTGRRERAARQEAFERMASAQVRAVREAGPARRAGALREFAAAARSVALISGQAREASLRPGVGPFLPAEAAVLAEAAACSEELLASGRLDGTLPGGPADFGAGGELEAWRRVFTVTGAADRRVAYLDLATAAEKRTNAATVLVLRLLSRAYLAQMPAREAARDEGVMVTVFDPKSAEGERFMKEAGLIT